MSYKRLSTPLQFDEVDEKDPAPTTVPRNLPAAVVTWLAMLAAEVRPMRTAHRFPHVVRQLTAEWNSPEALFDTFEALLYDKRGQRLGFPPEVLLELEALRRVAKLPPPKPAAASIIEPIAHEPAAAADAEACDHNGFRSNATPPKGAARTGAGSGSLSPGDQPLEFTVESKPADAAASAAASTGAQTAVATPVKPHAQSKQRSSR